jgi:NADH-quinone oxidoreductase subunit N
MTFTPPVIDYAGLSPLIALVATLCVVIVASIIPRIGRFTVALLTLIGFGAAAGLTVWQWGNSENLMANALRLDDIGSMAILIALVAAAGTVLLSLREPAAYSAGHGAYYSLLVGSVIGMTVLAQSINLISFFVGLELLSIPLYVLCGAAVKREKSLESGLKYLIVGSLGSATLLYGFALIYGATGSTNFGVIAEELTSNQLASDTLILAGAAMAIVGMAFKLSLAPFHQWAPDVYEGAPTPITGFMAVATKAIVFVAFARLLEQALGELSGTWDAALAVLAVISIVIGNVGALGQRSIKRLLGYSGIAQGGYILVGLVVANTQGAGAMLFYLAVYTLANFAVFAPLVARERESGFGDDVSGIAGIGRTRPWLAWPMTIGVLSMIGLPGTAGFIGKLYLIEAAVNADYT